MKHFKIWYSIAGLVVFMVCPIPSFAAMFPAQERQNTVQLAASGITADELQLISALNKMAASYQPFIGNSRPYVYTSIHFNGKTFLVDRKGKVLHVEVVGLGVYAVYKNWASIGLNGLDQNKHPLTVGCSTWAFLQRQDPQWKKIFMGGECYDATFAEILQNEAHFDVQSVPADVRAKLGLN